LKIVGPKLLEVIVFLRSRPFEGVLLFPRALSRSRPSVSHCGIQRRAGDSAAGTNLPKLVPTKTDTRTPRAFDGFSHAPPKTDS
jgi:hypothetical protein